MLSGMEYCGVFPGRGSQVVRHGSAKPVFAGSIPARASKHNLLGMSIFRTLSFEVMGEFSLC